MSNYCNGCKRDLENDKIYAYKKSICRECINKKVKCDYCNREFNSTNLSKHIKQIYSTLLKSDTSDSTLQRSNKSASTLQRSDTSDSTLQRSDKSDSTLQRSDSTSEITTSDQLYANTFVISLKKNTIVMIKKI